MHIDFLGFILIIIGAVICPIFTLSMVLFSCGQNVLGVIALIISLMSYKSSNKN